MADTPTNGETVPPVVKNDVTPPAAPQSAPAPQVNTTDNGEVEKLRKELEQAQMRANQLNNQLEAKAKAEEEARQKQLEDQNEFKSLYEQEKTKREAIENERQEAETKQALRLSEETIFAEFDPTAIEVAKEAGLSLTDDSDEAKAALKAKLEKIAQKVVTTNKVTPNNPGAQPENHEERAQLVQAMRAGNHQARDKVVRELSSLDLMRKQAGYSQQ